MWHKNFDPIFFTDALDVSSRMYPTFEECRSYPSMEGETRPLCICEYAHSMANGPGDIGEYWEIIQINPNICGAFCWQLHDHIILDGEGKQRYSNDYHDYGDGHFNIDGIFALNEKPTAREILAAYYPVEVISENGKNIFIGRSLFEPLTVDITRTLFDGKAVLKRESLSFSISPEGRFEIEVLSALGTDVYERIDMCVGEEKLQKSVSFVRNRALIEIPSTPTAVKITRGEGNLIAEWQGKSVTISLTDGSVEYQYFSLPLKINVLRAPIDNDMNELKDWRRDGIFDAQPYVLDHSIVEGNNTVIKMNGIIVAPYRRPLAYFNLVFTFISGGKLGVKLDMKYGDYCKDFPKFGLSFGVKTPYIAGFSYLGYGDGECYCDKKAAACYGYYTLDCNADCPYLCPQDYGNRYGVRVVEAEGRFPFKVVAVDKPFEFSVLPYSVKELMSKTHHYELERDGNLYVCIDAEVKGVGSNSCGPVLEHKYRVKDGASLDIILEF